MTAQLRAPQAVGLSLLHGNSDKLFLFSGPQFPHWSERNSLMCLAGLLQGTDHHALLCSHRGRSDTGISSPTGPRRPLPLNPTCQAPAVRPLKAQTPALLLTDGVALSRRHPCCKMGTSTR